MYIRSARAAVAVLALVGATSLAKARAIAIAAPPNATAQAMEAEVIVTGKIVEVEKDAVEATPFKGAPKEQKQSFKIAVLKIEDAIIGGTGLTQIRIGFPADAAPPALPSTDAPPAGPALRRPFPGRGPVALNAGQEGCFFLIAHHEGDFYVMAGFGGPLNKKEEGYAKKLEEVKGVAKTIEDPVTALKAKTLEARYKAALVVLSRYQRVPAGNAPDKQPTREPIPAEENKLIVQILIDLPWAEKAGGRPRTGSDPQPPTRSQLWNMINPQELGYKEPVFPPQVPGAAPIDYNKIMDEASGKFLKDNAAKIKIRKFVASK